MPKVQYRKKSTWLKQKGRESGGGTMRKVTASGTQNKNEGVNDSGRT